MFDDVHLNEYGFYTLNSPPSKEEMEAFYTTAYHSNSQALIYSDEDKRYIEAKLEQKLLLIERHSELRVRSFLDVGCGKGFAVEFFDRKGFDVTGLDYSSDGVRYINPRVLDRIIVGDIYASVEKLQESKRSFGVIGLENVLEHVPSPFELIEKLRRLLDGNGVLLVTVPNDFSATQRYFYETGLAPYPMWVAYPDHISYFNKEGLTALFAAAGFELVDLLADSLIELSVFNPNTNYFINRAVGPSCHMARVAQENLFHSISPEKTLEFYRSLGEMGLGRQIIGIFRPK